MANKSGLRNTYLVTRDGNRIFYKDGLFIEADHNGVLTTIG